MTRIKSFLMALIIIGLFVFASCKNSISPQCDESLDNLQKYKDITDFKYEPDPRVMIIGKIIDKETKEPICDCSDSFIQFWQDNPRTCIGNSSIFYDGSFATRWTSKIKEGKCDVRIFIEKDGYPNWILVDAIEITKSQLGDSKRIEVNFEIEKNKIKILKMKGHVEDVRPGHKGDAVNVILRIQNIGMGPCVKTTTDENGNFEIVMEDWYDFVTHEKRFDLEEGKAKIFIEAENEEEKTVHFFNISKDELHRGVFKNDFKYGMITFEGIAWRRHSSKAVANTELYISRCDKDKKGYNAHYEVLTTVKTEKNGGFIFEIIPSFCDHDYKQCKKDNDFIAIAAGGYTPNYIKYKFHFNRELAHNGYCDLGVVHLIDEA